MQIRLFENTWVKCLIFQLIRKLRLMLDEEKLKYPNKRIIQIAF